MEKTALSQSSSNDLGAATYSSSFSDLAKIQADWKRLFEECGSDNPFLSWDWNERWLAAFGDSAECRVAVVRHHEQLVALALVDGSRTLRFYADPFFADYANMLVHPDHDDAVGHLIDHLFDNSSFRECVFEPMRSDERQTKLLNEHLTVGRRPWRVTEICPNPVVDTTLPFDELFKARRKGLRQDVKTSGNHLNRQGGWSFQVASNKDEALSIYDSLVKFHLDRQPGKAGHSIFEEQDNIAFFADLIENPPSDFDVHLSAIRLDDRCISAAYSIVCGNCFYYWIPSFDHSIPSVSLGKLHIKCLIEQCCDSHIERFDFMGGGEPYKYQWSDGDYAILRFSVFARAYRAQLADIKVKMRDIAKAQKNQHRVLDKVWRGLSKFGKH